MSDRKQYLCISVGTINIQVKNSPEWVTEYIKKRFKNYIFYGNSGLSLKLHPLTKRLLLETPEVQFRKEDDSLIAERGDFILSIDEKCTKAEGEILENSVLGLISVLKILFSVTAIEHNSFFMHAGATCYKEQGWLFPGRSGTGKSTLVKRLSSHKPFSDEMPLVSFEDTNCLVHATPFSSELTSIPKPASAPLKGIMFLEKGKSFAKRKITSSESLHRLMQNVIVWGQEKKSEKILSIAEKLVKSCKSYTLNWQLDDDPNVLFS
ncbi:hypothetical protein K9N50_07915 [bacterium]|nr:hypothetical protein [bacterium]